MPLLCDIYNKMKSMDALVLSLPAHNSTMRMRVWRALKDTGCAVLRDGVYVLPAGAQRGAVLAKVESEIRSAGGFAMTLELKAKAAEQPRLRKLFDRSADYGALVKRMEATRTVLPKLGARKARTAIGRLKRSLDEISAIDFFAGHAKAQAGRALQALERGYAAAYSLGEPRASRHRLRLQRREGYRSRVWATRKNLWVDRLASAWLIKRFIDPGAKFMWLDRPRDRPKPAVGFDFDGAEFSHSGNRVTFEVLLASFGLANDPALATIATAVHFLDVGGIPVADAKGLQTLLRGAGEKAPGGDALLAEASRILDLLYSAYRPNDASQSKAGEETASARA